MWVLFFVYVIQSRGFEGNVPGLASVLPVKVLTSVDGRKTHKYVVCLSKEISVG